MASHGSSDPPPVALEGRPITATRSVLVVADDPGVRALVARILRRDGAEVAVASGGREALRSLADGRARPTILVTDIEMPGMSGIELAARVVALRPGIRVVMMTGDPASAETARRHRAEVDTVLLKPIAAEELLGGTRVGRTAGPDEGDPGR